MLGEARLHILKYIEEGPERTHSLTTPPPETTEIHQISKSPLTPRAAHPVGREKPEPRLTSITIPSCSVEGHWGMNLCGCGSCPSFCTAYSDLQLAGDTLRGPQHTHYPVHLMSQSNGSFLQSEVLNTLEASEETGHKVKYQAKLDEGYLVIESMRGPDSEPRPTNSMLNGYLETQLMEVYRQHMQDSLARCASSSLTTSVVPALVPANLSMSDGHEADQEDGLGSSSSHSSVRYLSTCSAPPTSHFSSPVLRISYPQEPNSQH